MVYPLRCKMSWKMLLTVWREYLQEGPNRWSFTALRDHCPSEIGNLLASIGRLRDTGWIVNRANESLLWGMRVHRTLCLRLLSSDTVNDCAAITFLNCIPNKCQPRAFRRIIIWLQWDRSPVSGAPPVPGAAAMPTLQRRPCHRG